MKKKVVRKSYLINLLHKILIMLNIIINNVTNSIKIIKNNNHIICLQCIRCYRKPRWLPVAKTKVFRVPERKKQDEAERAELMRLYPIYKTQLRSVRSYLENEYKLNKQRTTADHLVVTPEEEEAEFQRALQLNEKWNAAIAVERNARIEKKLAEQKELILQRLQNKEIREQKEFEAIEKIVRIEKEKAKTFITREKLDQVIIEALSNPVDYNFAIDLNENIYSGRRSGPNEENKKNIEISDEMQKLKSLG